MALALRREPNQRRSRERVERILAAASALIAEKGSDAMRMGEVAAKADVSIGSLYQYFPDKAAIIRRLAERYNAAGRACIQAALATPRSMNELRAAFMGLVDTYYALFLAEALARLRPAADRAELAASAFLIMQLGEATMRLAISVKRAEGDALVAAYKRLVDRELGAR